MKVLTVILLTIMGCSSQPKHCNWEKCPIDDSCKEYSDEWCIRDIHMQHPDSTYEWCLYILNVDCKDTMINE